MSEAMKAPPSSSEGFAQWAFGASLTDLAGEAPADEPADGSAEPTPDDAEPAEVEASAAEPEDAEVAEVDDPDAGPEREPDPVRLPFEATAGEDPVDPSLLSTMELTFKADGKEVTLPLTDIVRRAQSEPAAQRKARQMEQEAQRFYTEAQQVMQELETVRELAIRMARDPNFYADVSQQVAVYDTPEARAERAEAELAAERTRQRDEYQRAEFERAVQTFAVTEVAPTLEAITSSAPLVTEEEILGRFMADTARWTVNGVIHPRHHPELAAYLRTNLAEFVAQRQAQRETEVRKAQMEARKTQLARQKMKNQTAQAAKPVGTSNPLRDTPAAPKPRTAKEAEANALSVLINGL